jgi:hypothetical protein
METAGGSNVRGRSAGRALAAAGAAVAALGLAAGCGAGTDTPKDAARGAAETFVSACARDDRTAARETLTPLDRRAFDAAPTTMAACQRVVDFGLDPASARVLEAADVRIETIVGDSAVAVVTLPAHRSGPVPVAGRRIRFNLAKAPLEIGWEIAAPVPAG